MTDKEISFRPVAKGVAAGRLTWSTQNRLSASLWETGGVRMLLSRAAPTISSASSFVDVETLSQVATFLPDLRIVALLVNALISSSLWEINRIAQPSSRSRRNTAKSCSASCGVNTEVGSSRINNEGSCNKQRKISTRCCSPTDKSPTRASGESVMPYSAETVITRSFTSPSDRPAGRASWIFSATLSTSNSEKC